MFSAATLAMPAVSSEAQLSLAAKRPDADLTITVTASPSRVERGRSFTYQIVVKNTGPNTDVNVRVTDRLPRGVRFLRGPHRWPGGRCQSTGIGHRFIRCRLVPLPRGHTRSIYISVRGVDAGPQTDNARVTGSAHDPNPSNNQASGTAHVFVRGFTG
jgi:uncharacterized repeat protein (TIGR01451 family)